jgi:hypothetical protein
MSFDLAVWKHDDDNILPSDLEAGRIYVQLCNVEAGGGRVTPAIQEFYLELTRRYPEIDTAPEEEVDNCPWSVRLNRSGHHVIMSAVWSRAEEITSFVLGLAKKYGLILFDPQRDQILWPSRHPQKRWFQSS